MFGQRCIPSFHPRALCNDLIHLMRAIVYQVKPNSKGCLETAVDERYPKLFKITHVKGPRHIRLATVVFIHPTDTSKNPTEWTKTTAPMNTEQVTLFKRMIEDIEPQAGYEEKWRYVTDLPLDDILSQDRFHPRHMKLVFITPVDEKVCLRPNRSDESVFTVKRQHTNTSVSLNYLLICPMNQKKKNYHYIGRNQPT